MSGDEKSTDPGLSVAERKALRAQDFSNLAIEFAGESLQPTLALLSERLGVWSHHLSG